MVSAEAMMVVLVVLHHILDVDIIVNGMVAATADDADDDTLFQMLSRQDGIVHAVMFSLMFLPGTHLLLWTDICETDNFHVP